MIRVVTHNAAVEWPPAHGWMSPFGSLAFICNVAATMYWFLGLNQSWI